MEVKVNAIKFDADDRLVEFVEKKANKLSKLCDEITEIDVKLKVEKPAVNGNREAAITLVMPKEQMFADKVADTFEEAVTQALLALENQVSRYKEKQRGK
ncbi:MAG: ribosome-associated translation inhibitor RaiA [Prevotellaceae bacterium]|nr:ribosome-associated translation inhibitor RaiA [Candidatus Colivivens equi]MCQ2077951.1 HPF/RaiA family ribosome-associated protein [Bacteroidaceae bacterium]